MPTHQSADIGDVAHRMNTTDVDSMASHSPKSVDVLASLLLLACSDLPGALALLHHLFGRLDLVAPLLKQLLQGC